MAKTLVAVEITEASVRAAEITAGRTPTLIAAGEVSLPAGAARDSEVIDRDTVVLALKQLWAEWGIKGRLVTLGVGGRRILVREHRSALRDPVQLRQALPFEVQDLLPVPVEQAVLDFVPTSDDERGVGGLLVAAVAEHMEELVGALEHASVRAESVDLVAFGYARTLGSLAPRNTTLFIGIGEHTTQIVVTVGGSPRFVRVIPVDVVASPPADPFDEALISASAREDVLVPVPAVATPPEGVAVGARRRQRAATGEVPVPVRGVDGVPMDPSMQSALVDLVNRIRGTIAFYSGRPDASRIEAAWVSGIESAHPRLLSALAEVCGVPVTPLTIGDLVRIRSGLRLPSDVASRLVSTVSLVLGGDR